MAHDTMAVMNEILPPVKLGLSEREHKWCLEYLVDFDAANAAKRAGYPLRQCAKVGIDLMRREDIRSELQRMKAETLAKASLTTESIVLELAKLGFSNIDDYLVHQPDGSVVFDFSNVTREQMAAIAELTVEEFMDGAGDDARPVRKMKVRLHGKREALVDLGKHFGVFKEPERNYNFAFIMSPDDMKA